MKSTVAFFTVVAIVGLSCACNSLYESEERVSEGRPIRLEPVESETGVASEPESFSESGPNAAPAADRTERDDLPDSRWTPNTARRVTPGTRSLDFFRDPEFRRRIAESYLAETDIEPGVSADERAVILEAADLIAEDEIEEAIRLLREYTGPSENAVFDMNLATLYVRQEKLDQALKACRTAVEKFPKFRRAWQLLGQIAVKQQQYREAVPALTQVIVLGGGDGYTYGALGAAYASSNNFLSAETAFRRANLLQPESLEWKVRLADTLSRQGRFEEAISIAQVLIQDNPGRADLWIAQGEAYLAAGQTMKGLQNFEIADKLGGSTIRSLYNTANIYANEGIYDMAVSAFERALEKDRNGKPDRAVQGARYLAGKGAYDEAIRLDDVIRARFGESLDTANRKELLRIEALVASAEGAGEENARILRDIIEIDPLDGRAILELGRYYQAQGENEQAIIYYERAADLEDFAAEAKERHGKLLAREGKYAEAVPYLQAAQSRAPSESLKRLIEQLEQAAQGR
ncbi:MAG: tetratricopeptide repeat protein [Planctomycetota bacterium]